MKNIIIILLISTAYLFSVEFDIISFKKNSMDLAGRRNIVNDDTGNPCALIRVSSDLDELDFKGPGIVKKGIESSGKYYIYIKQMSKSITLIGKNINTTEYEIPLSLESTIVYNLELSKRDGLTKLESVESLVLSEDPEVKGIISNLQVAPFNNDIISFEVRYDADLGIEADKTVKLFLYNISTKKIFRIESSKVIPDASDENKFYTKDRSLTWHPTKNWFVFNGNGYKNREYIYICKINDAGLNDKGSIKSFLIDLYDQRDERSYCMYPSFDSKGKHLYFSRQLSKKDKKAKYNTSFSLTMIDNIYDYENQDFKKMNFQVVSEEPYDQFRVRCSPVNPNLIAYISYESKIKNSDSYYAKYLLNIYDKKSKTVTIIDNLDGFTDYSFQWSDNGEYIFYNKAVPLEDTEKEFIKIKINKLNLYYAKVDYEDKKLSVEVQKNDITNILLEDVPGKNNGIAFIDSNRILVSMYAPYNSLCIVDLQKWKNLNKLYFEKLDFNNDTDCPALTKDKLFYIEYEYPGEKTIVAVKSVGIER